MATYWTRFININLYLQCNIKIHGIYVVKTQYLAMKIRYFVTVAEFDSIVACIASCYRLKMHFFKGTLKTEINYGLIVGKYIETWLELNILPSLFFYIYSII